MPLVDRSRVGDVAFERLIRDRVCAPLTAAHCLPRDLVSSPALRARALTDVIPRHTVLSGLGGLWVSMGGPAPTVMDVVGPRGLHRVVRRRSGTMPTVAYHSGRATVEPWSAMQGIKVAHPGRCCIDALRWGDHREAIPQVMRAVRDGAAAISALHEAFAADNPRGPGYARLHSVWLALAPVLTAPNDASSR